jgi:hypothetical protein
MSILNIRDLACVTDLDQRKMSVVRGGRHGGAMPMYWSPPFALGAGDVKLDVSQSIGQSQGVVNNNGNNAAFVSGFGAVFPPSRYDATLPY